MQQVQQVAQVQQVQHVPQQMIITNGQIHNAQIINAAGQIVATTPIQPHITGAQIQAGQICQLVQTGNGTVQMIQQNGQPAQVVQIQRTSDDRCEIIMPSELQTETHYITDKSKFGVTIFADRKYNYFFAWFADEIFQVTTIEDSEEIEHEEEVEQNVESELPDEIEEELEEEEAYGITDDSECEDKEYVGE